MMALIGSSALTGELRSRILSVHICIRATYRLVFDTWLFVYFFFFLVISREQPNRQRVFLREMGIVTEPPCVFGSSL